jgi:hypothetical protein
VTLPDAYHCWINEAGIEQLAAGGQVPEDVLAKLATVRDQTFNSGNRLFLAAGIAYGQNTASDTAIMQVLAGINPLWHRLRWPGGNKDIIFEAYPTPEDIGNILQIDNFFTFGSGPSNDHFFGALENIHNWKFALSHSGVILSHSCNLFSLLSPWPAYDTYWESRCRKCPSGSRIRPRQWARLPAGGTSAPAAP